MNRMQMEDSILKYIKYIIYGYIFLFLYMGADLIQKGVYYQGDLEFPVGMFVAIGGLLAISMVYFIDSFKNGFSYLSYHKHGIAILNFSISLLFITFDLTKASEMDMLSAYPIELLELFISIMSYVPILAVLYMIYKLIMRFVVND